MSSAGRRITRRLILCITIAALLLGVLLVGTWTLAGRCVPWAHLPRPHDARELAAMDRAEFDARFASHSNGSVTDAQGRPVVAYGDRGIAYEITSDGALGGARPAMIRIDLPAGFRDPDRLLRACGLSIPHGNREDMHAQLLALGAGYEMDDPPSWTVWVGRASRPPHSWSEVLLEVARTP